MTSSMIRKKRTRTLIQLGGLIEKSGLLEKFDIDLGSDLQRDLDIKGNVHGLFGALLDLKSTMEGGDFHIDLWTTKGAEKLSETNNKV